MADKEILILDSDEAWWNWLAENHAVSLGVRLGLVKKGSPIPGVSRDGAVEAALCFGWIDGQAGKLNDDHWLINFQPRNPRSIWSRINTDSATLLIASGRMQPPGLLEVERAKADGRWDAAYEPQSTTEVPDDLAEALAANPAAASFFTTLTRTNRFAIIFRINGVKRAETRARKITEFVAMLERGETIHPQKARPPVE